MGYFFLALAELDALYVELRPSEYTGILKIPIYTLNV